MTTCVTSDPLECVDDHKRCATFFSINPLAHWNILSSEVTFCILKQTVNFLEATFIRYTFIRYRESFLGWNSSDHCRLIANSAILSSIIDTFAPARRDKERPRKKTASVWFACATCFDGCLPGSRRLAGRDCASFSGSGEAIPCRFHHGGACRRQTRSQSQRGSGCLWQKAVTF